eukprot:Colp12_sorted_trinity150504_noHs@20750
MQGEFYAPKLLHFLLAWILMSSGLFSRIFRAAASETVSTVNPNTANMSFEKVAFGAGCFWGTEKFFRKEFKDSLKETAVGYMGGHTDNPKYKEVCSGQTNHAEVLYVEYYPEKVKFEDLVTFFYRMHDPTTLNRQGNDVGTQYRSAIFYYTPEQKSVAEAVTAKLQKEKFSSPITTEIAAAQTFYRGEDYHQLYLEKNPGGYCNHRLRW